MSSRAEEGGREKIGVERKQVSKEGNTKKKQIRLSALHCIPSIFLLRFSPSHSSREERCKEKVQGGRKQGKEDVFPLSRHLKQRPFLMTAAQLDQLSVSFVNSRTYAHEIKICSLYLFCAGISQTMA